MKTPTKPFPGYKWRWAEFTPSEGLNHPLRYLGVLRAMYRHQGEPKSTASLKTDLERIERETNAMTGEHVHLARVGERNLFRNSDRYWKALGLMENEGSTIQLTSFGKKVAQGKITQTEFAVTTIKTLTLPNTNIEQDLKDWQEVDLQIRPLELILDVIKALHDRSGDTQSYLTPFELQKIVIPLAGIKSLISDYVEAIDSFRKGNLDIALFPECAPGSNDKRMVREFLLFLWHYGFCLYKKGKSNKDDKFFGLGPDIAEFEEIKNIHERSVEDNILEEIRNNPVILTVERQKILTRIAYRPQQPKFRKEVLAKFNNTCMLTGEKLKPVLEACHIISVEHNGTDTVNNGLCLRADLHILFDFKHIRFRPDGVVEYSDAIHESKSYSNLPQKIEIPKFTSIEALSQRYEYY